MKVQTHSQIRGPASKFLPNFTGGVMKETATRSSLKRAFFALLVLWVSSSAFAQGWVNFMNNSATLFSVRNSSGAEASLQGTYYFSFLTAPPGTIDPAQFTFSGLYATNQAVPGRFSGGTFVVLPNWAAGTGESFLIAGWSASLGLQWNQAWLNGMFSGSGYFGLSSIGTGVAGGIISTNLAPLPPLNPFGGTTGIQSGFSLYPVGVPEPSTIALAALGGAMLGLLRRKRVAGAS